MKFTFWTVRTKTTVSAQNLLPCVMILILSKHLPLFTDNSVAALQVSYRDANVESLMTNVTLNTVHTDVTASPSRVCRKDTMHTHTPDAETETRRRKRLSVPRAGAWADVAWHGHNKAQCFFTATLSIKAGVPGLTYYLSEGSMETQCDYTTWSVSAEVSMSGTEDKHR